MPPSTAAPITLTTDFGLDDGYVGIMRGVILGILPWAQIVDITHAIAPQNIRQAAYVLGTAAPYFPRRTVHVVVVDPGVGTERRPLAIFTERACYVGPDNGVFSLVYASEPVQEIRRLTSPHYRLPDVSNTFHGRDIFAPFAAHIAAGAPPHSLGPVITDPVQFAWPQARQHPDGSVTGEIMHADRFGNLISNIPVAWMQNRAEWIFELAGNRIQGFAQTYGRVEVGQLVALGGSEGMIEIAIRNGNAAQTLGVVAGERLSARPAW